MQLVDRRAVLPAPVDAARRARAEQLADRHHVVAIGFEHRQELGEEVGSELAELRRVKREKDAEDIPAELLP